jgi:hypothetical protein
MSGPQATPRVFAEACRSAIWRAALHGSLNGNA